MANPSSKQMRRSWLRSVGFQLAETLAVTSQIALLCPSETAAWTRRETARANRGRPDSGRRG